MHPILARFERLAAYLASWFTIGILVALVITRQGLSWPEALVLVLPPLLVYAFVCLSAWYVCRAMPLTSGLPALLTASIAAAAFAGGFWMALSQTWIGILESLPALGATTERFREQSPYLLVVAVMLFLLVLSLHYVVLAFEAFRAAEHQQLELQVLSRDAELRALRAQINPHFLYNSLNSISALTSGDPGAARRMCLLLADFLRTTLHMSTLDQISLQDELTLADRFLSIEQVRFGSRLRVERHVDEDTTACRVPPLLLQPLLENAVAHGIAGLVDGGVIRLEIHRDRDRLTIAVENPRDVDAPWPTRGGVGLDNVRRRLAVVFGVNAQMEAVATPGRFRVMMSLPWGTDG
ncbi:MAG: histidine kinase [Vicinamibacterales bacterium]